MTEIPILTEIKIQIF